MSISTFIRDNMSEILAEWTAFAQKTAPSDSEMTKLALTDHAEQILSAIALDIETVSYTHLTLPTICSV